MISGSFNPVVTHSSSASHSNSSHFHPHTPQVKARTHNLPPNRSTQNVQNNFHYSPSSPHTPSHSTLGVGAGLPSTPSSNRTRSQTEANSSNLIVHSPRRNNSSPTTATILQSPSRSAKLTGSNLKPLSGNTAVREVVEQQRLPTPPPSPPFITRVSLGNGTPTKTPVRTQSQRKKELTPLDVSSRQRQRDMTITQSYPVQRSPTGPKKSNNHADGHSLASTESCSTGTSASSVSHLHVGCVGYSAYSSHSSLDGPLSAPPLQPPPLFSDGHHFVHQSQSIPSTPTKPFNARKASTQCRAIQGYVSFANVEGLGEPPLVIDEFDGDGFVEDGRGKGRKGSAPFLPLLSAALGWKRFLGGAGAAPGIGHGVEGQEQGLL
jgi:hypothetical protein